MTAGHRGVLSRDLSRRQLLRYGAGSLAGLSLGGLLAACSSEPTGGLFDGPPDGVVNFANRPLFIDRVLAGTSGFSIPSLELFRQEKHITVNYRPIIENPEAFFGAIEPYLVAGEPTGWDVAVITNGQTLSRMIDLNYLVELPERLRPNFERYAAAAVRDPDFDPENRFTMPWQSDVTGIAYDPQRTGRTITSVHDLFDSEFSRKVGLFGDLTDLPNLALLAVGVAPEASTTTDWQGAAALIAQQLADGVAAIYTRQGAIDALSNGEVALTMARSADLFRLNPSGAASGTQFVIPDEGGLLWTENMVIPKGAQHPVDAMALMDFVYQPRIAAMIAAEVGYLSPVPDARTEVLALADEAAATEAAELRTVAVSPLVFPSSEDTMNLHTARVLESEDEADQWELLWSPFVL
ncbi:MAG TPA: extracellular solute-binding protein [Actinomycetota bacterium]|nr:extracellular solute-binding protein [Actinomycetota bacterium]